MLLVQPHRLHTTSRLLGGSLGLDGAAGRIEAMAGRWVIGRRGAASTRRMLNEQRTRLKNHSAKTYRRGLHAVHPANAALVPMREQPRVTIAPRVCGVLAWSVQRVTSHF